MNKPVLRFCGNFGSAQDASQLANYKPPTFPPPDDFFVSTDKDGNPLSRYTDDYWNFKSYGCSGFNFGRQELTLENNYRLKQLMFVHLYHMPLFPGKIISLKGGFTIFSKLCKIADYHSITIDHIYRFPRLANDIINTIKPAQHNKLIQHLNALLRAEGVLGWKIADTAFIEQLAKLQISHIPTQNAYIPPRIWMTLIQSAEQVMDSFEQHQDALTNAWVWIYEAYKYNIEQEFTQKSPFIDPERQTDNSNNPSRKPRRVYPGGAKTFFKDFGVAELLNRWVGYIPSQRYDLHALSTYVTLVRDCAFTFILAHSIQRRNEGLSLRSDCFQIDEDPMLGKVGLLVGETTKTDPDSDARWVVPMSVGRAVKILNDLSRLRLNTTFESIDPEIQSNPYLMTGKIEYWGSGTTSINALQWDLGMVVKTNSIVFDAEKLVITQEDYNIAYQLTPTLKEKPWFEVGGIWSFNAHQLRRTLSVNLFASDVPERVIQWMMKHKTLQQSYYYGRNYTRLRVNNMATQMVVAESYLTTVRNLVEITENSLGNTVYATCKNLMSVDILKLIKEGEHKKLEALVKNGQITARPTLLGFCMTNSCEYGGVESAVHCAGVDSNGPCKDAVFKKKNGERLKCLQDSNADQLKNLSEDSPRHSKLKHENEAIEVYFHATS
ncbi:MAG: hypothetical protein COA63_010425 [Methylophaga sp.]|nr:hypothetical protein [Methylophaga sp.]